MTNYLAPILFVSTPYIGGVWGSLVTKSQMKWYDSLKKPKFTPPKWLFGPMWTLLYGCMGTASYLVWRDAPSGQAKLPLAIYGIHLLLNWSWSHVFFGAHKLKTSVLVILLTNLGATLTAYLFNHVNGLAGKLFIPYILWINLASAVNIGTCYLNEYKNE